jgi:uncharacterized protein with HEPN domain
VVVHDYLSLDLSVIWDVVSADLPALKSQVEQMLNDLAKGEE